MKRPVLWSRDALDELIAIARHIARDDPRAARRVALAIRRAGEDLGEMDTGRRGRMPGTREKVVTRRPFVLAYVVDRTPEGVEQLVILRAIHTARYWSEDRLPD